MIFVLLSTNLNSKKSEMITKVAARKPGTRSSFNRLAAYIADAPRKGEKVLHKYFRNVEADNYHDAVSEIKATQNLNNKTKADKTYHLIVAFPLGEVPKENVIKDIEESLLAAIGLEKHQRVSAIHKDTSHLHLHIAVNKVNSAGRVITPHRDYLKLNKMARELEKKHNLFILDTNKKSNGIKLSAKATDVETQTKETSFQRWAINTLQAPIEELLKKDNLSWNDIHNFLAENGLQIKPRGRGLIITDYNGKLFVKPSLLNREFSKGNLEKRIGKFEKSKAKMKSCSYKPKPLSKSAEAQNLYAEYKKFRESQIEKRNEMFDLYKKNKQERLKSLQLEFQEKRRELNSDRILNKKQKYNISKELKRQRKERFSNLYNSFRDERNRIMEVTQIVSWSEYLIMQAEQGNSYALSLLRTRDEKAKKTGNSIIPRLAKNKDRSALHFFGQDIASSKIHGNGDITYQMTDNSKFIVGQKDLHVYGDNCKALKAALLFAQEKYGNSLEINGNDEFLASVATVIKENNLHIRVNTQRGIIR